MTTTIETTIATVAATCARTLIAQGWTSPGADYDVGVYPGDLDALESALDRKATREERHAFNDAIRVELDKPRPRPLTIAMSERRPLKIDPGQWPLIASATWYDSEHKSQANRDRAIRVREHADGRRIVYGSYSSAFRGERGSDAGYLVDPTGEVAEDGTKMPDEAETIRAIRRVAGVIGDDSLGAECIADLPAEEV